jgi:hypothetical protein
MLQGMFGKRLAEHFSLLESSSLVLGPKGNSQVALTRMRMPNGFPGPTPHIPPEKGGDGRNYCGSGCEGLEDCGSRPACRLPRSGLHVLGKGQSRCKQDAEQAENDGELPKIISRYQTSRRTVHEERHSIRSCD